jgi:membrane protein YdbS with pleckstrin-like domain
MENNNSNRSVSGGIGFSGLLTIVFIVLKLCNVIDWSWLWVLAPLWISFALGIIILIVVVILQVIIEKNDRW